MRRDTTAIILAEGPDLLAEVLGRPRVHHILDALARAGLTRVALCASSTASDALRAAVGASYRGLDILHAARTHSPDTCSTLGQALQSLPSQPSQRSILVLEGEKITASITAITLFDRCLPGFLDWFAGGDGCGALLLGPGSGPGVETDATGRVMSIAGKRAGGWTYAGACLLRPERLAAPACSGPDLESGLFPALAASGELLAWRMESPMQAEGAGEGRAAVFLDRDGTVIEERNYLSDPAGVALLPGAAEGLRRMRALGLRLVLVSNQSGVGRGYFGRDAVERVHGRLLELLEGEGVRLDALYVCPHAPSEACACRKPLPGLITRAAQELGLDPAAGFVIGDKPCDMDLGQAVGATTFLATSGYGAAHAAGGGVRAHHVVAGLAEAAEIITDILARRT